MADYVTLDTLAKNFNDNINTISTALFDSSDIERDIPFNVVNDIQDYLDDKVYSTEVKVPGIMNRLTGAVAPSQVNQSYNDLVLITIYAYKRELDDTMLVIDNYIAAYTGKFIKTTAGWAYQQTIDRPSLIDRGADEGEERVTIILEIKYDFILNGYVSDDILVSINGVEVPIITYTHSMETESTVNDDKSEAGIVKFRPKKSTIQKTISYIDINNTELKKVFQDIDTGAFLTRTYTVRYAKGFTEPSTWDYDESQTMVVVKGDYQFSAGGIQVVNATLVKYNGLS